MPQTRHTRTHFIDNLHLFYVSSFSVEGIQKLKLTFDHEIEIEIKKKVGKKRKNEAKGKVQKEFELRAS